ncbi:MAG: DUF962 domain-containing protein [Alphaproteobacteria bacterium]|nr:DUF962 domain-containing protein [Alphaproteobacteria bacterium]
MSEARYESFEEFWPYYLSEHRNPVCRGLHYVGTSTGIAVLGLGILTLNPFALPAALVTGYGGAWVGHFIIEKNRPATFKYPGFSLRGDFRMLKLKLTGKLHDDPAYVSVIKNGQEPPPPRAAATA